MSFIGLSADLNVFMTPINDVMLLPNMVMLCFIKIKGSPDVGAQGVR